MTHPDDPRQIRLGVMLARQAEHLGEWLADATAYEAAGADVLWVEVAADSRLDPLALTAALAAVTYRSVLVTSLPAAYVPSRALSGTLGTVTRLSRGRLRVLIDVLPPQGDPDIDAVPGFFRQVPGEATVYEHAHQPDEPERWARVDGPRNRAAWRDTLRDAAETEVHGLLVPAGPRLLDILRNPEDPGERHDLQLAVG